MKVDNTFPSEQTKLLIDVREVQERNRKRGRMPGQLRLRIRYRNLIGPWFDYLIVSPDQMATIVEGRLGGDARS